MAELRDMQATLRRLIAACRTGNTPECPILEALRSDAQADQPGDGAGGKVRTAIGTRIPSKTPASTRHQTRRAT